MKLKVGDQIKFSKDPQVIREIVEVRDTGYTWKYPETTNPTIANTWISENSSDPHFDWGWELV